MFWFQYFHHFSNSAFDAYTNTRPCICYKDGITLHMLQYHAIFLASLIWNSTLPIPLKVVFKSNKTLSSQVSCPILTISRNKNQHVRVRICLNIIYVYFSYLSVIHYSGFINFHLKYQISSISLLSWSTNANVH